ncbi:MAG: hypothetical protein ACUVR8_12890 [Acidobacteriota bacterium]
MLLAIDRLPLRRPHISSQPWARVRCTKGVAGPLPALRMAMCCQKTYKFQVADILMMKAAAYDAHRASQSSADA